MSASHDRALDALQRRGRLRALAPRRGIDFASNDYLALANSSELRDAAAAALTSGVAIGSGGSRLLRGNHDAHEQLETEAAAFFGSEAALYFSSGYAANSAVLATLPSRGDLIIHDALIHASAHDGMRLSKADVESTPHNDITAIEDRIAAWRKLGGDGQVWIAVESLYSMDGDRAPLDALTALADRHNAMLLIDEAHATGVYGPQGRGLASHFDGRENVVTLHTCGKALGVAGALVTSSKTMRDFMINRARGFIYSTAPSPLIAATVSAALKLSAASDFRRTALEAHVATLAECLVKDTRYRSSGSPIQPIIVGSDTRAVALAERLQNAGFDVRAIRPPTVAEGTARLRLTLTLNASTADIERLVTALAAADAEVAA